MNKLKYIDIDSTIIGYKFILSVENTLNGSNNWLIAIIIKILI